MSVEAGERLCLRSSALASLRLAAAVETMPKLNILEVDEDGGFDLDNVEVVEEEQERPPPPPPAPPRPRRRRRRRAVPMKSSRARGAARVQKGGRGVGPTWTARSRRRPPRRRPRPRPRREAEAALSQPAHKIFELRERGAPRRWFAVGLPDVGDPALVELTPARAEGPPDERGRQVCARPRAARAVRAARGLPPRGRAHYSGPLLRNGPPAA